MNPEQQNADNEELIRIYKGIYGSGGFGYNRESAKKEIDRIIIGYGESLLDVGCGDGFWADILAERFKVTGIDISPEGIEIARTKYPNIRFILGDFLTYDFGKKFDILFMRSPSFLNFETYSDLFKTNLEKSLTVCRRALWYIKWSVPPYNRYLEGSYIHDPENVKEVFSWYGNTTVTVEGNYFYAKLEL